MTGIQFIEHCPWSPQAQMPHATYHFHIPQCHFHMPLPHTTMPLPQVSNAPSPSAKRPFTKCQTALHQVPNNPSPSAKSPKLSPKTKKVVNSKCRATDAKRCHTPVWVILMHLKKKKVCRARGTLTGTTYVCTALWHLAFGIWHLAFGIWHLAVPQMPKGAIPLSG
jgi:hypothetical protein